jgi:hypothetical protein
MEPKFVIRYTKNEAVGYFYENFVTREEAEKWVADNKTTIYWSEIVEINASSKLGKVIASEIPNPNEWNHFEGYLDTFTETGMECLCMVLETDEPKGEPNPHFDSSKPESSSNFKNYKSYENLHFIEHGNILEVDGVRYAMLKDREFAKADNYNLSFYPIGFSRREWLLLFMNVKPKRATLYVKKK